MKWLNLAGILLLIIISCIGCSSDGVKYISPEESSTPKTALAPSSTPAPIIFTLNTSVSPVGTGSISPSSGEYQQGSTIVIKATPSANCAFTHWSGDAGTIGNVKAASTTVTMNGNYTITANFDQITYTTKSANGEGFARATEPSPTSKPAPPSEPTPTKKEFKAICVVKDVNAPGCETYKWLADQAFERSNGQLQIEVKSLAQLRMKDKDVIPGLRYGDIALGEVLPIYVSERIPIIEGVSLPGLFDSWDKAEKAHKAWQEVLNRHEKEMGGYFLGSTIYQKEYIFSSSPIMIPTSSRLGGIASDWGEYQLSYFDALFGDALLPIHIPEQDIYTAVEKGTCNDVISDIFTGYKLKLYEHCLYLIDLQLGTKFGVLVAGQKFWEALPENLKDILIELGAEFTEKGFAVAQEATLEGIENNKNAGMLWIPTKPEWVPIIREAVKTKVVPEWINRSGSDAENLFNDLLAPHAGFTAHAADLTPPVISGITISEWTESSVTIIWTTDEESTSQVEYWVVSTNKFNTTFDKELVNSHRVTLDGLDPDITYKFSVKSKDASGNEATKGGSFNLRYLLR